MFVFFFFIFQKIRTISFFVVHKKITSKKVLEYNFVLKINFKNPPKKYLGLNNSVYFCRRPKSNFTNISEFYFSTENKLKRGGDRVKVSGEVCKSDSTIEPIYIGMDLEKFTPGNFPLENSSPRQVLTVTGTHSKKKHRQASMAIFYTLCVARPYRKLWAAHFFYAGYTRVY